MRLVIPLLLTVNLVVVAEGGGGDTGCGRLPRRWLSILRTESIRVHWVMWCWWFSRSLWLMVSCISVSWRRNFWIMWWFDCANDESVLKWSMKHRGSIFILLLFPPYSEKSGIAIRLRSMKALRAHSHQSLKLESFTPTSSNLFDPAHKEIILDGVVMQGTIYIAQWWVRDVRLGMSSQHRTKLVISE